MSAILLATDLSRGAQAAEQYAYALASSWGVPLRVITVLEFPPGMDPDYAVNRLYLTTMMTEATQKLVDVKLRANQHGLSVDSRIATGIPYEEVLAAARAEETAVIVVGTRGNTGLKHILLGSTAERVIRMAPCPVLAVPVRVQEMGGHQLPESVPPTLHRILVPIDFSDCALDALEYAALVAQRAQAALTLLHVLEPVAYGLDFTFPHIAKQEQIRAELTGQLSNLVSACTSAGVSSDFTISGGLPADSILETARSQSIDMIVMGTHGRRGLSHTLFGSITESVLRRSLCPVLTIRSPKFQPGHRRVLSGRSILTTV
ncbi:MAG: universal stress protein [Nitrospira sp.]|nr:universal stress protein [Nitrospira sp.]